MRRMLKLVGLAVVLLVASPVWAHFEVTPEIQEQITQKIWLANGWAGSAPVVDAVLAQNQKGPIAGMDNPKWKTVPENDAIVQGFIKNEAAAFLKEELEKTDGIVTGAFLIAAQGEKVAFTEKTGSYIQKGAEKFDAPFTGGKAWQGKPELDDSGKVYEVQVSVPVQSDGRTIGVLVVEINATKLAEMTKK
jgi:ribosome-associated translation inhibitor RaiA